MRAKRDYNLFLDDIRIPSDAFNYTHDTDFLKMKWEIVRSYEEFTEVICELYANGRFPKMIAFDHDLADVHYQHLSGTIPYESMKEKTGMHCAKWLIEFCIDKSEPLPDYKVHSMNPVGKVNIISILENFKKHYSDL